MPGSKQKVSVRLVSPQDRAVPIPAHGKKPLWESEKGAPPPPPDSGAQQASGLSEAGLSLPWLAEGALAWG